MPSQPPLCWVLALHLLALSSRALAQPPTVAVRESVGVGQQRELQLIFPRLSSAPALARLSPEDARAFLHALESSFQGPSAGVVFATAVPVPTPLERSVLQGYLNLYGPPDSETAAALGHSRWLELHSVGMACLRLYQEAQATRTQDELDAVAERFGQALGE